MGVRPRKNQRYVSALIIKIRTGDCSLLACLHSSGWTGQLWTTSASRSVTERDNISRGRDSSTRLTHGSIDEVQTGYQRTEGRGGTS